MAVVRANYVKRGKDERKGAKANIRYMQERPGRDKEKLTRTLFGAADSMDQCAHAVPFTTQTRLTFEVVLPLWGHRGPHPTPPVDMHHGRRSAKERQRS